MTEQKGLGARLSEKAQGRTDARKKESASLMGESIEIRSIMVAEKHRLIDEAFIRKGSKVEPVLAKLVPSLLHKSIYDPETGTPAFATVAEASAFVEAIPDGDAEAEELQKVIDTAMRVSGLNDAARREAVKNSEASED